MWGKPPSASFLFCFRFFLVLSFSQGFLPCALPLDLCLITAIIGTVFDAVSCCGEHLAAVFAGTRPAAALCRILTVEFHTAVGAAEQGVRPFGCKFLTAALTGQREGLTDSVFSSLDFLIPLPAFDAVPLELFLPQLGGGAHLFHKHLLIGNCKGADRADGVQNQGAQSLGIISSASVGRQLICMISPS